ncbi:MAG TPA: VOC family protein [Candidatus Acidoferrales bacterium]|nr:VOC family protein [Candidatus Acidoferrales bacterium]
MSKTQSIATQRIYPALRFNDAKAAIAWLCAALGCEEREVNANEDGTIAHAELWLDGNVIMLGSSKPDAFGRSPKDLGGVSTTLYVACATSGDVDAHYQRAKNAGARILREPTEMEYGSHEFSLADPEGHVWSFGTYQPQ